MAAAQLTVTFSSLHGFTFLYVVYKKRQLGTKAKREGTKFDRYNSPDMLVADRLNANLLEWAPIFLGLLWSLAATNNYSATSHKAAWTYVALRALYIPLILQNGVSKNGLNRGVWASTFPAYACLIVLSYEAVTKLFFEN